MMSHEVPYAVRLRDALGRATRARGLLCWCRAGQRPRAIALGPVARKELLTSAEVLEVAETDGVMTWRGIPLRPGSAGDPDRVVVWWPPHAAHPAHAAPLHERLTP